MYPPVMRAFLFAQERHRDLRREAQQAQLIRKIQKERKAIRPNRPVANLMKHWAWSCLSLVISGETNSAEPA